MTSSRPYLIRGIYEWIADNDFTPYVLIDVSFDDVVVPEEYVNDGKMVVNISMTACRNLELGNEYISFNARFSGKATDVSFPVHAVLAIYAKENGQGMMFESDDSVPPDPDKEFDNSQPNDSEEKSKAKSVGKPSLKIVK